MTTGLKFTNLADLLKASPFDAEYDIDGTLTPELFYRELHVESERSLALMDHLKTLLDNSYSPSRVILLSGFSGSGKTTFLQTFMRREPAFWHVYFDIQPAHFTVPNSSGAERDDELVPLLSRHLRALPGFVETLRFIGRYRDVLRDEDFISARLHAQLARDSDEADLDPSEVRAIMQSVGVRDTFASLFIHLLREPGARRTIVYFDNLDAVSLEYIADRLMVYFQDALSSAVYMSRHPLFADLHVDFRNDYRFVFCMRDANAARLNAHLSDRIAFARLPFTISFEDDFFSRVAAKRVRYLEANFPDHDLVLGHTRLSELLTTILEDRYFQSVFLPLFNYDYRALAGVLVEVIVRDFKDQTEAAPAYAIRGRFLFGVVRSFLESGLGHAYLTTGAVTREGYEYIDRVMLTVLANATNYRRGATADERSEPYGLLYLVNDLRLIYRDLELILDCIARCAMSPRAGGQFITILNTTVDEPQAFVRRYMPLLEFTLDEFDDVEAVKMRNELTSTLVRLNPAGFTYIRHVLPSFEFYANIVQNSSSLFDDPLRRVASAFAFERKIDAVLALVRRHVESSHTIFERRYAAAGITAGHFPGSKYCFRHLGVSRLPLPKGQSHTVRLVATHVDYIDRFRIHVLRDLVLSSEECIQVNELLLSRIAQYVKLLDLALDREAAMSLAAQFRDAIERIAASGYHDAQTRIAALV